MKGIVLETRGDRSAVLLKNGEVRVVRGAYTVGESVRVGESAPRQARRYLAAAAAVLVLAVSLRWYQDNCVACAEVSLDAGGAIVYQVNRHGRLIGVQAADEEAEDIVLALEGLLARGETFQAALDATLNLLSERGVDLEQSEARVTVSAKDERARSALTEQAKHALDRVKRSENEAHRKDDMREDAKALREDDVIPSENDMAPRDDVHAPRDDDAMERGQGGQLLPEGEERRPERGDAPENRPDEADRPDDRPAPEGGDRTMDQERGLRPPMR